MTFVQNGAGAYYAYSVGGFGVPADVREVSTGEIADYVSNVFSGGTPATPGQ